MKVCIVAEGCYPYVVGGVSGWINSMIKSFPNIEFILLWQTDPCEASLCMNCRRI